MPDFVLQEKITCHPVNFAVTAYLREKILNKFLKIQKKPQKIETYLDLARELKKLWNMKVMITPLLVCAIGTVHGGLKKKKTEETGNK